MRLHWFIPFLRKRKKNETLGPAPWIVRLAQRFLPAALFSDREKGKPGLFRKILKRIGPTAHSSPVRRLIQSVCFATFVGLFFYVCWPYTARPLPPGEVSENWRLSEFDQQNGHFTFSNDHPDDWLGEATSIHLVDAGASAYEDNYVAEFEIVSRSSGRFVLRGRGDSQVANLDLLFTRSGPWAMHQRAPDAWPEHYAKDLEAKEIVPADTFLVLDPLVSLSTAIASRSWVWSLACAGVILLVCILIPRGFCGYLCPLGTLIDLFDWSIASRVKRFRVPEDGWWVHIKYYVLLCTLMAAVFGVLVSGFVAAIPVITRGFLFLLEPLQVGWMRGWHQVTPLSIGNVISIVMFVMILCLGFLKPRFWCKYVCPSGAVFSLGNLFRVSERKVESSCINCNKCVEICPFDAIKPDFTTRVTDCTLCQSCGGVCPTHSIKFVERWNVVELKVEDDPPTGETPIGRRGFMSLAAGTSAAVAGSVAISAATGATANAAQPLIRPPGSVPEREFLDMCIRCGECFKVCPNNVLHATGFERGLESLWTPKAVPDWAGCESSCNACGQVCPTGAIRALPIEEKKVARMGLAIVNDSTCLPVVGEGACDLCVVECEKAGYHAIEQRREGTQVDDQGIPIADSGFLVPIVLADKCVGCGLCQTRCYGINVKSEALLAESAIVVHAGPGNEDRMMEGSYQELRRAEQAALAPEPTVSPDPPAPTPSSDDSDPFGVQSDSPF